MNDHAHHAHMNNVAAATTPCPMHAAKMLSQQQQNLTAVDMVVSTVANVINDAVMGNHGHHGHNHRMMGDMMDNSSDDGMMMMYFHGGYKEVILFDFWKTRSIIIFVVSCLVLFVVAALYEGIKLLRETLIRQEILANSALLEQQNNSRDENTRSLLNQNTTPGANANANNDLITVDIKSPSNEATSVSLKQAYLFQQRSRLFSRGHIIQTFLHMFQVTISYLLMLVFMTYNSWLCLSVILGAGLGYFFFGYKRLTTIDANEHCH